MKLVTLQNAQFKDKKGEKRKRANVSQARDRNRVASMIDQHDNHYTTLIADWISEIKYLHR